MKVLVGKDSVSMYLKAELEKLRDIAPLLKYVRGEVLTPDHWQQLFKLLGMPKILPSELTLGSWILVGEALITNAAAIKELNNRALGEVTIREALQDLKNWGAETVFILIEHIEFGRSTPLIKEWKELMTAVGDNQSLLQSLKDSPYYKMFMDEINTWDTRLSIVDECMQKLNNTQRRWVYLEPIFARGSLPQEQTRFNKLDTEFRAIMAYIDKDKRLIAMADYAGIKETLSMLIDQLERCQKALNEFLEEKRARFPRFYFIGDDDLLEILGQAQNPTVIQAHLKKLFQGIHSVVFSDNKKQIIAMKSSAGELVKLFAPVNITDHVEEWLFKLTLEMKATLKALLVQCLEVNDIANFPSQILCVADQVHFT